MTPLFFIVVLGTMRDRMRRATRVLDDSDMMILFCATAIFMMRNEDAAVAAATTKQQAPYKNTRCQHPRKQKQKHLHTNPELYIHTQRENR